MNSTGTPAPDVHSDVRIPPRLSAPTHAGFGTLGWAQAKDGAMSRREQVREVATAVSVVVSMLPAQARQRLGFRNKRALAFDPSTLLIPDSSIAKDAEALCREASPEYLVTHCFRTYVWGMLLGQCDGVRPDPEMLYVASMLHDLALTDQFRDYAPMPCFGARAAIHATDWAGGRGWTSDKCTTLGNAISLHLNSRVSAAHGPEAQLLQAGAGLDVIGLRYWDLTPQTIEAVLEKYPRLGLKSTYKNFKAEAHPRTRAQLLDRWLLFGTLMRLSQFDE